MNFLYAFDNSSFEPRVLINGKERYVTKVGGLMTIMGYIVCLVLAGYFVVQFFERKDLNVVYSRESDHIKTENTLFSEFFIYKFSDYNSGEKIDPRVASLKATQWVWDNDNLTDIVDLETMQCKGEMLKEEYKELFKTYNLVYEEFTCFDNTKHNTTIIVDFAIGKNRYINIYLARCIDKTDDGQPCYPEDEVNKRLADMNVYFDAYYLTQTYNHSLIDEPLVTKPFYSNVQFGIDLFKTQYVTFKTIIYDSDSGLVLDGTKTHYGTVIDDTNSFTDFAGPNQKVHQPGAFGIVQYNGNGDNADRYKRSYPKLQQLLANIMGVVDSILLICGVVSNYLSYQMMIIDLSNIIIKHVDTPDGSNKKLYGSKPKPKSSELSVQTRRSTAAPDTAVKLEPYEPKQILKKPLIKRLGVKDAILLKGCVAKDSPKQLVHASEEILKKHMSIDYFLRLHVEFERLKKIMLTDVQYRAFEHLSKPTIEEYMKMVTVDIKELEKKKDDAQPLPQLKPTDEVSQRMLKLL
jgi:hypothetical protein